MILYRDIYVPVNRLILL